MNFSKNIYWLRLQLPNRLIYNFSFAKVNTEIHIHNWREKMSTHVTFDYSKALSFIGEHEITYLRDAVKVTHHAIHEKTGAGNDFLGWVDLPLQYDKEEFARIQKCAEKLKMTLTFYLL